MKTFVRMLRGVVLLTTFLLANLAHATPAGEATCFGKFVNPISDLCWSCVFPISIGAFSVDYGQEDIENPASPVCICPIPVPPYYRMGIEVGFWEPTRLIEVTRTPFCFPALGGVFLGDSDYTKPPGATDYTNHERSTRGSFYQLHYYLNPVLYYLNTLIDGQCLESGSYDLAYMTEYDPTWHNDQLTAILEPEAALFANPIAILACSADCVAASVGFGLQELFWCSGCNGVVYPMNGNIPAQYGGLQGSSLLVHRFLAKMHRQFLNWQWHGEGAVCNGYPQPLMDKRGYKTQLVYPIPNTSGSDGSGANRCCQPLGRTTQVWGIGKEYPIKGEDFAYQIFRKRNCCMS